MFPNFFFSDPDITTTTNATTMQSATQNAVPPRQIDNLRAEALDIVNKLRVLQEEQLDTISRYLRSLPTRRLASDVRKEIEALEERLDLIIAEYIDRRRI